MRKQFGRLINAVNHQLQKNGVSVDDVATLLKIDLNSNEFKLGGKKIQNIADLILKLRLMGYMQFYYLVFLEKLVEKFAEVCKQDLDAYKHNHLRPYLLKCIEGDHVMKDGLVRLHLKVDREQDTMPKKWKEKEITKKLAAMVGVPEDKLVIDCTLEEPKESVESSFESDAKSSFPGAKEAIGRLENCPPTNKSERRTSVLQRAFQDEEKEKEAQLVSNDIDVKKSAPLPISSNAKKCYRDPCSLMCSKPLDFPPWLAEPKVSRVIGMSS